MKVFNKSFSVFDFTVLLTVIYVFYNMTFNIHTDIELHAQFIKDYAFGAKPFQVNFLYYLTVYALSFFQPKTSALLIISVYVLSFATFFKYFIVKRIIIAEIQSKNIAILASLTSFLLLFAFSLPSFFLNTDYNYLLRYTPNVWHNSTTIFVMPFVILLFWLSVKQLNEFKKERLFWITILLILNVVIKPSFLFVYVVIFPIFLLVKFKFKKVFWINLIPIFITSLLIVLEYLLIYNSNTEGDSSNSEIKINLFNYFYIWGGATNKTEVMLIFVSSLFSSFLFPLIVLVKNRLFLRQTMTKFVLSLMFLSILISIVFVETGKRSFDGNFMWQNYMVSYLLFFVCAFQVLKHKYENNLKIKNIAIELVALSIHFAGLIFYFIKIYQTETYF